MEFGVCLSECLCTGFAPHFERIVCIPIKLSDCRTGAGDHRASSGFDFGLANKELAPHDRNFGSPVAGDIKPVNAGACKVDLCVGSFYRYPEVIVGDHLEHRVSAKHVQLKVVERSGKKFDRGRRTNTKIGAGI